MNQVMQIANQEIQVKEFNGQRVVTFKDIDLAHERPSGTAKRNFSQNKFRFIEGQDYVPITRKEFGTNFAPNEKIIGNPNLTMLLITESGYLVLVKSFTDDLAWKVQRQLVNCYFRVKEETTIEVTEHEKLTKKDYLKIADCISRTSSEGLPLLRIVLNKLAPEEFENIQQSRMSLKIQIPTNFPNKLVTALQENKMTQKELAEKSGYARSSINNYVHGRSNPSGYVVDRISEILNVNFYK